MEIGGLQTRYLFADELKDNEKWLVQLAGTTKQRSKKGDRELDYVTVLGTVNDLLAEYKIAVWSVTSDKPFNTDTAKTYYISKKGKFILFEPN